MLSIARAAIRHGLKEGQPARVDLGKVPAALREPGAAFVNINLDGRLRGCIGSLSAHRPLAQDIAANAHKAAFEDPRFGPMTADELDRCELEISLLSPHVPFPIADEDDLVRRLRPGRDGLTLNDGEQRALFLPSVWDGIPDPRVFVTRLKQKAGWAPDHWSPRMKVTRFTTEKVSAATIRALAGR